MQYAVSLIFPIISYLLQIYPRLHNRYFGVDVWTLLAEIDLIRNNKHLIPRGKINKGFIVDGYFDYPPLFLIMLSFLPQKFLLKNQGFISPLFDALLNIALFFLVYSLTGGNVLMAVIAQLIYTCIPVAALENTSLLPRSLGYALFMLTFYFLLTFTSTGNQQALIASIVLGTMTLLAHKFATQSFFFVSVFFTLFERNPIYLGVLLASAVFATLISRGYYLAVLQSHIGIITFWIKNRQYRFAHQVYGNVSQNKNPDLIGIIYKLLIKFAPVTLLSANPWIISAFLILFLQPVDFPPILFKLSVWVIFFYIFGIVVLLTPRLTPIGEGYRYMEMTTLPSAILSTYLFFYLVNSTYGMWTIVVFSFLLIATISVIILVQKKAVISDKNRSLTEDMNQMFSFINKLPGTPRIMCIPHQITTMVVYNTKADVLVNFDVKGFARTQDFFPILRRPVKDIAKDWEISHLLIRESFVKLPDIKLNHIQILHKSGDVILIKL